MSDHTIRWQPPAHAEQLIGPGGWFEIVTEQVVGRTVEVFKQRQPHLRAALQTAAANQGALPYLNFVGRTSLSFADVAASAARVAAYLADQGVQPGDRVGFASVNTPAYGVSWWATVCMGAVTASLNGWWTGAELAAAVELSRPAIILADAKRLQRLQQAGVPDQVRVVHLEGLEALVGPAREDDPALPDTAIAEDDPAVILFTSGSTGRAKGATLSHRNLIHSAAIAMMAGALNFMALPDEARNAPRPQPNMLLPAPLFHVSGLAPLMVGVTSGVQLVLPEPGPWDETTHLELTQQYRIGNWTGVPTQLWRLMEHPRFDEFDTSSVTVVGGGGAVYAPELYRLVKEKLPQATITTGYGMSETFGSGTRLSGLTIDSHPDSVGLPEPMTEVQVRDASDRPLPDGEVGQICIRGACVFLGYWDNEAATRAAVDDEGWYRTGDYGHITDGVLHLESRMRDMIIRGGENIYPVEIENRLVEHPDIAETCVVGVPHRHLGQEVAAVVVLHDGARLDAEGVRAWAADALAAYKVPTQVEFRTELPYSQTGKVLKRQVEEELAGAAPGGQPAGR